MQGDDPHGCRRVGYADNRKPTRQRGNVDLAIVSPVLDQATPDLPALIWTFPHHAIVLSVQTFNGPNISDMTSATIFPGLPRAGRIEAIDIARGGALVAMAVYHFTWDLEFFGYTEPGLTAVGGWKLFARCIASSFLFLVGVGLFLAHRQGIRWRGFFRRLAMIAGAAAAISLATYIAVPGGFIFFGILHEIALASLLGLAFLRLPATFVLLAAALVIAAPHFLRSELFDHPVWWWTGLSTFRPHSNDYVPVFPWFGAVLIGVAVAKRGFRSGLADRLTGRTFGAWSRPLILAGRHSLAFYLIHQPVLIACLWLFSQAVPPQQETMQVRFLQSCQRSCEETRDTEFCTRYCVCMIDGLEQGGELDRIMSGDVGAAQRLRVEDLAGICTAATDGILPEGGNR